MTPLPSRGRHLRPGKTGTAVFWVKSLRSEFIV